jgi:hypothetical protein
MKHLIARASLATLLAAAAGLLVWTAQPVPDGPTYGGYIPGLPVKIWIDDAPTGFHAALVKDSPAQTRRIDTILDPAGDRARRIPAVTGNKDARWVEADAHAALTKVYGLAATNASWVVPSQNGQSSGLATVLALLDSATAGSLLPAGQPIVATGTIDQDGKVGAIGGIRAKAYGVAAAGIEVFLIPADNVAELGAPPLGLKVYPVATLEEAVKVLCDLGADSVMCNRSLR